MSKELRGRIASTGRISGKLGSGSGGGIPYRIGDGLKVDAGVLSVDTADAVEQDNTKPVTSAAVHVEIGNIEVLLAAL